MKQKTRRSQTALEYLVTYSWAILLIVLVFGAAYYYGAFSPEQYLPNTCILEGGISCIDHKVTDEFVEVALVNRLEEDINITGIAVPGCTGTITGTLLRGEQGKFRITGCNIDNNSRFNDDFNITYIAKSGIEHNLLGAINGKVITSNTTTTVLSFMENGASVNETNDAQISFDNPNTNYGTTSTLTIDQQGPRANAVVQFPNIVGNGIGQIPPDAQINSAVLRVNCVNGGSLGKAYLLLENWTEMQVTWNNKTSTSAWGNAGADGVISRGNSSADWVCDWPTGYKDLEMTSFVQSWASGTANYGVVAINTGSDGFDFYTSEDPAPANRPMLTVNFTTFD